MVEMPKGELAGQLNEGYRFPLRANLLAHKEREERLMFQGGHDHSLGSAVDHQGGGRPVGSGRCQELEEFSVVWGGVACYPPRSSVYSFVRNPA
jgi:hypothetical protein